jgi:hypothetical protein
MPSAHGYEPGCLCKFCKKGPPKARGGRGRGNRSGRGNNPSEATNFGNGEVGGGPTSSHPVHGADVQGNPVTASFGIGGDTYLADGHVEDESEFWGPQGAKGHDHYGTGNGPNNNGTQRGRYTGSGS